MSFLCSLGIYFLIAWALIASVLLHTEYMLSSSEGSS